MKITETLEDEPGAQSSSAGIGKDETEAGLTSALSDQKVLF